MSTLYYALSLLLLLIIGRFIMQKGTLKIRCPYCKGTIKLSKLKLLNLNSFKKKAAPCPNCHEKIIQDKYTTFIFIAGFVCVFFAFALDSMIGINKWVFKLLCYTGWTSIIFYFVLFKFEKTENQ